jgi:hypothetical protein
MNSNAESLTTREKMSASEYREASWKAYEGQVLPPDPSALTDEALHAFLHYEEPELLLPSAAQNAVVAESQRRGRSSVLVDQIAGLAMLVALPLGGVLIGLGLLIP